MKTTVNLTEYRCDACGKIVYADPAEPTPPSGFWGVVNEMTPTGAITAEWYADKERCVRHAVLRVLAVEDV